MAFVFGEIDRASENVEQTPVDLHSLLFASFRVQQLGVFSLEVWDRSDAKFPQVHGNALTDAGDDLQFFDNRRFQFHHRFFKVEKRISDKQLKQQITSLVWPTSGRIHSGP